MLKSNNTKSSTGYDRIEFYVDFVHVLLSAFLLGYVIGKDKVKKKGEKWLEERKRQADENMERIDALLTRELAFSVKSGDVCSSAVQALALAKIALEMSSENLRKEEK